MARWRLKSPHYINVPGTEWQQEETNEQTKKKVRKLYPVPTYLNPDDPADWTNRERQIIVVCYEGKGNDEDLVFFGDPTPEMEPMDKEAEAISASLRAKWEHPIESLPATGTYDQALIAQFESMMTRILQGQGGAVAANSNPDLTTLMEQMAQMQETIATLQAQLIAREEPLPEVEPTEEEVKQSEAELRRRVV